MNYWIIPSNENKFNLAKFLSTHNNVVDWKQSAKFEVGDVVYIYCTRPQMRIRYKMDVIATDIPSDKAIMDKTCWSDEAEFKSGVENDKYFRMKLTSEIDSDFLTMDELHRHGVNGYIQRGRKISKEIISYIEHNLGK